MTAELEETNRMKREKANTPMCSIESILAVLLALVASATIDSLQSSPPHKKAKAADTASYIEIVGQKHDYPAGLKLLHTRQAELYGI